MRILSKYLTYRFLQQFLLTVCAFIALLLVMRMRDIAKFATLGATLGEIAIFILLQIPHILPVAIPIACLVAGLTLSIQLSDSQEITALRASGISLSKMTAPLLIAAVMLTVINFATSSELAPFSKRSTSKLVNTLSGRNPLVLFEKQAPFEKNKMYAECGDKEKSIVANDALIAFIGELSDNITVASAKELTASDSGLKGRGVALVTKDKDENHSILKNSSSADIQSEVFLPQLKKSQQPLSLSTKEILQKLGGNDAKMQGELFRRLMLGFAPITLTLLGIASGVELSRNRSIKGALTASLLAALFMAAFFFGKRIGGHQLLLASAFILPHTFILLYSFRRLQNYSQGNV